MRKENGLLLVIDMQNAYAEGNEWACHNVEKAAENIKKIIASHESDGYPQNVAFTQFLTEEEPKGIWKDYCEVNKEVNEDPVMCAMMDGFADAEEKYPFFVKSTYSSLTNPEVLEMCKKADHVAVSGVVAECCVLATAMALIDEGIYVVYLTDACAGIDEKTEAAVELILSGLEPLHVKRMTTEEYLKL